MITFTCVVDKGFTLKMLAYEVRLHMTRYTAVAALLCGRCPKVIRPYFTPSQCQECAGTFSLCTDMAWLGLKNVIHRLYSIDANCVSVS